MIRFTLVVIGLYAICCAFAWGQTSPPDPAPQDDGSSTRPAPRQLGPNRQEGPIAVPHGGSILKSQLMHGRDEDPDRVRYSDLSILAVPLQKPRVLKKHDLITIIVREESQSSSSGTTDLKKNADLAMQVDSYVRLNLSKMALEAKYPTPPYQIKGEFNRDFKGEAQVDRTDTFTARIGAEVVDVKPNGTLVIQARKHIKADEEEQDFILTGVCRAEDVGPDNTVLSNTLHDLDVKKSTRGAARDTQKRGWIPRILDLVNPF
jgi:flagellar L-ring protein precursor FlgH